MAANNTYLNYKMLNAQQVEKFTSAKPFPHFNFNCLLDPGKFEALHKTFPAIELFERHVGISRPSNQRPHNRLYLAFEESVYSRNGGRDAGLATRSDLSSEWISFIEELKTNEEYLKFLGLALGVEKFSLRFAWHLGHSSSEVSPHLDAREKLGSHLFYFNTDEDWNDGWGGQTVVLGGYKPDRGNPEFTDFPMQIESKILNNYSFLFKNEDISWHGVRHLKCPEGSYRKLFTVIIETPNARKFSLPRMLYNKIFGSNAKSNNY